MDALVAMTMAARLGGRAFIFSDGCSDTQHVPCQSQALGKVLWDEPWGFFFKRCLAPIVQMRELRETCPGSAPTDAWKLEPVARVGCLSLEFINLCSAEWRSGTG